jgi:hypothetical protein
MKGCGPLSFEEEKGVCRAMAGALRSNDLGAFRGRDTAFLGGDARGRLEAYLSAVLRVSMVPALYVEQDEAARVPFRSLVPEAARALEGVGGALPREAAARLGRAFEGAGRPDNRSALHRLLDGGGPADALALSAADVAYCHAVGSGIAGVGFSEEAFLRDVRSAAARASRRPGAPRDPGPPPWGTALRVSSFAAGPGARHAGRRRFRAVFLLSEFAAAFRVLLLLFLFAAFSAAFGWAAELLDPGGAWGAVVPLLSCAASSAVSERAGLLAGSPSYAGFRGRVAALLEDASALRGARRSLLRDALGLGRGALAPVARAARSALAPARGGRGARKAGL